MLGRCAGRPARASISTRCSHELRPDDRNRAPRHRAPYALLAALRGGRATRSRKPTSRASCRRLAPMIETISPAVVNIAVTSNVHGRTADSAGRAAAAILRLRRAARAARTRGRRRGLGRHRRRGQRLHPHEPPRHRERRQDHRHAAREPQPHGARRRLGRRLRSRGAASRRRELDEHPVRRFDDAARRRLRRRDRQSVRLLEQR